MNPQKLAGQCAKLKCCLNFETDSYAEAQKKLPPKDVTLETKDNTFYYFKPDILAHKITYSTDRNIPANLVTISASRAFEIIALNKQGIRVDSLDPNSDETSKKEYGDIIGQDSLTRFDKNKKKKKKKKNKSPEEQRKEKPALEKPRDDSRPDDRPAAARPPQDNRPKTKKKPKPKPRQQEG